MQIKGEYSWVKHLDFLLVDLAALLLSFLFAYYSKFSTLTMSADWKRLIVFMSLIEIIIYLTANPYSGIFRRRYYFEIGRAFMVVAGNGFILALILYALKIGAVYSREAVINTYIIYFFVSVILKYIWKKLRMSRKVSPYNPRKIPLFLISDPDSAEKDIHSIYSTDLVLYDIRGVYLAGMEDKADIAPSFLSYHDGEFHENIPVISGDYIHFILENNINEVLISSKAVALDSEVCKKLVENGVNVDIIIENLLGFQSEEQFVANISVNKTLSVGEFSFSPAQSFYLLIKRLFDIFCGLIGLVVLVPVTAIVKLAYLLTGDKATIIYRQKRVGQNGKPIRIWKFRSMVPDAEAVLQDLLKDEKYRKEWDENQKFEHDPRITKIGSFLRKTSIDELPQLINVLLGDMSLVGPRPLVEGELAAHNGLKLYEKVKPGITGWWGCNGRSIIDYRERLQLEYYYVKNCSFYLDILCIIRTIFAVLKKDGAQ